MLLEAKPEVVKIKNNFGDTPLHSAAKFQKNPVIVELILKESPDATIEINKEGNTPLHEAASKYRKESKTIKALLEANPEATKMKNSKGNTPLHEAARWQRNSELTRLILEANPEAAKIVNNDGNAPLHIAIRHQEEPGTIKLLLKANPKAVTVKDGKGETPLDIALKERTNSEIIKEILKADPSQLADKILSLLLFDNESTRGNVEFVKFIFKENPDAAKLKYSGGQTLLHRAIFNMGQEGIKLILGAYPDAVKMKTDDGDTPLKFAAEYSRDPEVIRLILEADPSQLTREILEILQKRFSKKQLEVIFKSEQNTFKTCSKHTFANMVVDILKVTEDVDLVTLMKLKIEFCGDKTSDDRKQEIFEHILDLQRNMKEDERNKPVDNNTNGEAMAR